MASNLLGPVPVFDSKAAFEDTEPVNIPKTIVAEDDRTVTLDSGEVIARDRYNSELIANMPRSSAPVTPAASADIETPFDTGIAADTGPASGAPGAVAPASTTNTSKSPSGGSLRTVTETKTSEKGMGLIDRALTVGMKTATKEQELIDKQLIIDNNNADDMIEAHKEVERQKRDVVEKYAIDMDKKSIAAQEAIDRFATMEVDPNRLWGSRSTGDKLLAGIAIMMGAYGAGATGGPNSALAMMDNAIDRDIDAQKAAITRTGMEIDKRTTLLDQVRANFTTEAEQRDAVHAITYKRLAAQVDKSLMSTKSELAKNKLEGMKAELLMKAGEAVGRIDETRIQTTEMPPVFLEPLKGTEAKDFMALHSAVENLDALAQATDTGLPMAVRISILRKLGLADAEDSVISALHEAAVQQELYRLSGTAVSAAQAQQIRNTLPSLKDNPKAFHAVLDAVRGRTNRDLEKYYTLYGKTHTLLPRPGQAADIKEAGRGTSQKK